MHIIHIYYNNQAYQPVFITYSIISAMLESRLYAYIQFETTILQYNIDVMGHITMLCTLAVSACMFDLPV